MQLTRKQASIIFVMLFYFSLVTWSVIGTVNSALPIGVHGDTPLTDFWYVQIGGPHDSLLLDTVMMVVMTNIGAFWFIYIKNNKSFYHVQARIGYKIFLQEAASKSFLSAFFLSIATKLYELLVIVLLTKRLPSNTILPVGARYGLGPFYDNTLLSFAIFVLLSSLGWGAYAVFIFALGLFIKKNSIYLVLGAVLGTVLITGIALFATFNLNLSRVLYMLLPSTLIAPGQLQFGIFNGHSPNVYLSFLIATLIYAGSAVLLFHLWREHRKVRE